MDRDELVDIRVQFKFFPKSGRSIAVADDEEIRFPPKPLIFLPRSEVEMYPAMPDEDEIVTVTMPQWLAEDKGLV